jgi:hypothetical protein
MEQEDTSYRFRAPAWAWPTVGVLVLAAPLLLGAVMPWSLALWLGWGIAAALGAYFSEDHKPHPPRGLAATEQGRRWRTPGELSDARRRAMIAAAIFVALAVVNDWFFLRG